MISRRTALLCFAIFLLGLGLRAWAATFKISTVDSDMAVLGLMGKHAQEGNFSVFHWGQDYGGAQETYLAALIGFVTGPNLLMLQLTTGLLALAAAVLMGLIAREFAGDRAGLVAYGLGWTWSAPFVWWSLKMGSNYWFAICMGLAIVYALARGTRGTPTAKQWAVIGVLVGQALWANPQAGYLVIPAVLRYWRWIWVARRYWLLAALTGAVGALPWVIANIKTRLASFKPYDTASDFGTGARGWWDNVVPQFLGLPSTWSIDELNGWPSIVLLVTIGVLLVVAVNANTQRPTFAVLALIGGTLVYFASPQGFYGIPRYYVWLFPWLVIAVAQLLGPTKVRWPGVLAAIAIVLAIGSTALTLRPYSFPEYASAGGVAVPRDDHELIELLAEENIRYAYADYWIAYRVTFETQERTIAAPYTTDRHGPYVAEIDASGAAAHIVMTESRQIHALRNYFVAEGIGWREVSRGPFTVLLPDRLVTGVQAQPSILSAA